MTSVEIVLSYAAPPTEQTALSLARTKDVYGIRRLSFDIAERTLHIEYDATRLNAAAVTKLVREAGLELTAAIPVPLPYALQSAPQPAPVA